MKNIIFIRVDSSTKIGYGHFMRCMALADTLQKNFEINFITRSLEGSLISYIQKKGFGIFRFYSNSEKINEKNDAQKTISLIKKHSGPKNILIVDNYQLSKKWETDVKPFVHKLIVIDDLSNRLHNCDLLIDQNLHTKVNGLYKGLIPSNCVKLIGPKFSMIRKEFRMMRKSVKPRTFPIKKILVSFGGSDIKNQTLVALNSIKKMNGKINVDVVVGKANKCKKTLKIFCNKNKHFTYHEQIDNIADLMLSSDLSIGSSGSTTWERCCLGLPAIVSISSNDQRDIANSLSRKKCIINLGDVKKLKESSYINVITNLKKNDLRNMSKNSMSLVDGNGTQRVFKHILLMAK